MARHGLQAAIASSPFMACCQTWAYTLPATAFFSSLVFAKLPTPPFFVAVTRRARIVSLVLQYARDQFADIWRREAAGGHFKP
jgi:hypothetical protein